MSIGDDTNGAFRVMALVSGELRQTSSAEKFMYPGKMMKSLVFKKTNKTELKLITSNKQFQFYMKKKTLNSFKFIKSSKITYFLRKCKIIITIRSINPLK